jgi:two-component system response regulator CpxR
MLPEQNGFEILRGLRQRSSVPVILLTARGEDVDRAGGSAFRPAAHDL